MLWTIAIILMVLWFLGLLSGGTVGVWVHLLLLFSLVSFALAFVHGSRPILSRSSRHRS